MIAATMFPTFDVPPQHAETVGARKARKQKEDETTRRASSATSQSSGSSRNVTADKPKSEKRSVFGWGSKSKSKEIQEIPVLPSLKKPEEPKPEPAPSIAPSDWSAALEAPQYDVSRRPSQRSFPESHSSVHQHRFPPPPRTLPSAPPSGALPPPPSPGPEASLRGMCLAFLFCRGLICKPLGRYAHGEDCARHRFGKRSAMIGCPGCALREPSASRYKRYVSYRADKDV